MQITGRAKYNIFLAQVIILISLVLIYISCAGCGGNPTSGGTTVYRIGPVGGTLIYNRFKLIIPGGALTREVTFSVNEFAITDESAVHGTCYAAGPSGVFFLKPCIINIGYNESTPDTAEANYILGNMNNGKWLGIGGSTVETTLNFVSGETNSLSVYGVVTNGASTVNEISIEITVLTASLEPGDTKYLAAIASPDVGSLVYNWTSSKPDRVSVAPTGTSGEIYGVKLGVATITAYAVGKVSPPCTITCGDLIISSVEVTPESASMISSSQRQFYVAARNAKNQALPDREFTWNTSDPLIATVDANGLVYAVSVGACAIYSTCEGYDDYADLTVIAMPAWTSEVVNTSAHGGSTSIAFNSSGDPCISFYDGTNFDLKYATYESGTGWIITCVASAGDVGQYNSLKLYNDSPRICYCNLTSNRLMYASFEGTGWHVATVDSTASVGKYNSLALDASGNPHISYYDDSNNQLKYAKLSGSSWTNESSWTKEAIDGSLSVDVGWFSSIALDSSNYPHISYYDFTNRDLKYARYLGYGWVVATVDNSGDVGQHTSLALYGNNPSISYYDITNTALKYVKWTGSIWEMTTVDNTADVGLHTSLAFDSTGKPRIGYFDDSNDNLKYAFLLDSVWYIQVLDSDGDVGPFTSLAIKSNKAGISYIDTIGYLKYTEEQ